MISGQDIIIGSKKKLRTLCVNNVPVVLIVEELPEFLDKIFDLILMKLMKYHRVFFEDNVSFRQGCVTKNNYQKS